MDYVTFPFEKFVSCITTEYDVQTDSILALYIEIGKYLRDNPIVSGLTVKEIIDKYLEENPPAAGVVSVNGKTGVVTGLYDADNPPPYPVTSVNGKTGDVVIQEGGGSSGVTSVNGKTGAVTGLYDAENPPPYPVESVNGKTGIVTGLYDQDNPPPYPVTNVLGRTGSVNNGYYVLDITEQNTDANQNIPFKPLDIIRGGTAEGTLPAGNSIKRYLIFNETTSTYSARFVPISNRAGLSVAVVDTTKSEGRFALVIETKNVSNADIPLSYYFSLINFSNTEYTIFNYRRNL